jgi:hypothetical protein
MIPKKTYSGRKVVNFLWKIERGTYNFVVNSLFKCSVQSNHSSLFLQPSVVAVVVACHKPVDRFCFLSFFRLPSNSHPYGLYFNIHHKIQTT